MALRLVRVAWGGVVWAAADEVAMPLLGLAQRAGTYPVEAHLQSLSAHLVYGITTELAHRLLRFSVDSVNHQTPLAVKGS
jgi:uncharacterized membrane protein YagU involved in acid resistance